METTALDSSGVKVVEYLYDSWGKLISISGSLASTVGVKNPYRYRGYRYDTELGLYYLQSRYYDPEMKRFINADAIQYLGFSGSILGYSLLSYCENNPIKYADTYGDFISTVIGAVVGGIIGGISAARAGDNVWAGVGIGAATGAISGLAVDIAVATGGVGGIAIAAIGGALASGIDYSCTESINGREIDHRVLSVEIVVGAAFNVLSFGTAGGSLKKVGGKVLTNMCNDFVSTIMEGTTRKVAGQIVKKSAKGVAKNIAKNIGYQVLESVVMLGGSFYMQNAIQYSFWGMTLCED